MHKSLRIVVADDDPDMRYILSARLAEEGFLVTSVDNGREAVISALKERPDVIVLDAQMPVVDGFQACTYMKHSPVIGDTPIIMFTGVFVDDYEQQFGLASGADAYVSKGTDLSALIAILRALAQHRIRFGHFDAVDSGAVALAQQEVSEAIYAV